MKRIAVIGSPGSGKSVFARELGAVLEIEVIHLDALFFKPGWVATPRDEWVAMQQRMVEGKAWIIDGHYRSTLEIRLAAADTVVLMDLPRTICLWRAVRRWLWGRRRPRPDLAPGCPEKLDWAFLKWIWEYPKAHRSSVLERLDQYRDGKTIIRLQTPAEVRRFLEEVRRSRAVAS